MQVFTKGKFFVGCNYWASHAGTNMWADWRADIVAEDLQRLAENKITTLRVFPMWPVFQPITMLYAGGGVPREYRFGEEPLPDTEAGRNGVSEAAMAHFAEFCSLAQRFGIRLIVGLVTGWMSGRLFVPPALDGHNVLTDPEAIMWECRFVRYFVKSFRENPAILAWDLGNECNCMAPVSSAEEFYVWVSSIVGAIRAEDASRAVISGMHSLLPDNLHTIQHQGELTDYLTTHPYPYYTPHCDMDPINSVRTEMHAVAESLFYSGIGGKPCFVEECGTLGPMMADEERAADFIRTNLFSLWAHDCLGLLWWCANEQSALTQAPYDWNSSERELGLFRLDKSPKPVLEVLRDFSTRLEALPALPPRIIDGVCVLSRGQDTWGAAYMSFILAKKAGLDLRFAYSDQALPEAPLYLLPSISGDSPIDGRRLRELLLRVEAGAALYISLESGLMSPFEAFTGMCVEGRQKAGRVEEVLFSNEKQPIPLYTAFKLKMKPTRAQVLAVDCAGDPVYSCCDYGMGKVFFLTAPLETALTRVSDAFRPEMHYHAFYRPLKDALHSIKVLSCETEQNVFATEHIVEEGRRFVLLVNYDSVSASPALTLQKGWKISRYLLGGPVLEKHSGALLELEKN